MWCHTQKNVAKLPGAAVVQPANAGVLRLRRMIRKRNQPAPLSMTGMMICCSGTCNLLRGEVIHRHRILKQRVVAGDHGDAAVGDEITLAVSLGVVADYGTFGDMDIAVNDGTADAAVPA